MVTDLQAFRILSSRYVLAFQPVLVFKIVTGDILFILFTILTGEPLNNSATGSLTCSTSCLQDKEEDDEEDKEEGRNRGLKIARILHILLFADFHQLFHL